MANVTATDEFFADPRFDTAALHLGLEPEVVRMRMLSLWSWQTEHYTAEAPTYVVPVSVVVGKLKHLGAPAALVAADLAEEQDGGLYLRGSKGRIEWLHAMAPKKQKGGFARAAGAARDARGRLLPASPATSNAGDFGGAATPAPPAAVQHATSTTPDAGPATQLSGIWDLGSGIREERERITTPPLKLQGQEPRGKRTPRAKHAKPVETPIPEDFTPNDAARALAAELRLDLAQETSRWRDNAAAKGRVWVDHQAALRTWLRNSAEYRARDAANGRAHAGGPRPVPAQTSSGLLPIVLDEEARRRMSMRRRDPISLEQVEREKAAAAESAASHGGVA